MTSLCHGVLSPRCKTTLVHRPVSNTYYPEGNEVWHWQYFVALAGCAECRSAGSEESLKKCRASPSVSGARNRLVTMV